MTSRPRSTQTARQARQIQTILVVDDDPMVLDLLQLLLRRVGMRVATAADGKSAIARARQRPPALVVIDQHLPDASGEAIVAELRLRWGISAPVIVMSGDPEGKAAARRVGAVAFLPKPFDQQEFHRVVDDALSASKHE